MKHGPVGHMRYTGPLVNTRIGLGPGFRPMLPDLPKKAVPGRLPGTTPTRPPKTKGGLGGWTGTMPVLKPAGAPKGPSGTAPGDGEPSRNFQPTQTPAEHERVTTQQAMANGVGVSVDFGPLELAMILVVLILSIKFL